MSKNAILFPFSISTVNFILLWKLFNDSRTWLIQLEFTKQIVSSTYLFVLSYILLIIILIVCSKGTLVNSGTPSNDTIWYPGGILCFSSVL